MCFEANVLREPSVPHWITICVCYEKNLPILPLKNNSESFNVQILFISRVNCWTQDHMVNLQCMCIEGFKLLHLCKLVQLETELTKILIHPCPELRWAPRNVPSSADKWEKRPSSIKHMSFCTVTAEHPSKEYAKRISLRWKNCRVGQ